MFLLIQFAVGQLTKSGRQKTENGILNIAGSELRWVAEGNGIPCLVIGSSVYYPRTFSAHLRKYFRFYFVDLKWFALNHGNIDPQTYTLNKLVDEIELIRKGLKLAKPVLLGHSIHGTIAMEYAKKYPGRISRLVMIGSPNYFGNKAYDEATTEVWNSASAGRKSRLDSNWKKMPDRQSLSGAQVIIDEYCVMAPKYWRDSSYDAQWLWKDMTIDAPLLHQIYDRIFLDYYMFRDIDTSPVPTFVAVGRFDFIIPALMWQRQQDIKGLTVHVFENSGHTPQLEEPDKFDEELLNWISQ